MTEKKFRAETIKDVKVVAKDREGNIKGEGIVTLYAENKKGYEECLKVEGYAQLMYLRNRQAKSDVLNTNRIDPTEGAEVKKEIKETRKMLSKDQQAALDSKLIAMVKEVKEAALKAAKGHK